MSLLTPHRAALARKVALVSTLVVLGTVALPAGCSSATRRDIFDTEEGGAAGDDDTPTGPNDAGPSLIGDSQTGCQNLECQLVQCDEAGPTTTVTGTVYDPSGKIPLYNAIVYVPQKAELPDLVQGATCDRCGTLTVPSLTSDLSDVNGEFKIENVPVGDDIPIVVQVGKWRKVVHMKVEACKINPLEDKLSLPKNQQEGSMPRIAVSTGNQDALACLLSRIGIDDAEFTLPGGTGAVQIFSGSGYGSFSPRPKVQGDTTPMSYEDLWDSPEHLAQYDVVLLACEGDVYASDKSDDDKVRMRDYLNLGGRVFATHYHTTWFKDGPEDVQTVAEWGPTNAAGSSTDDFSIDRTFAKGEAFGDWLELNGASDDGETISLSNYATSVDAANDASQQWIYGSDSHPVKYISFNTPVGFAADEQCGRGVISDIHVSTGDDSDIPSGCSSAALTAQEKALLFLLMDLSSCVQDDQTAPTPPH